MNAMTSTAAIAAATPFTLSPALAGCSEDDSVSPAIAAYLAAYEESDRLLRDSSAIEDEIIKAAVAAAEPRMQARINFEAAHPDHVFFQSREALRDALIYEERRKLDGTPQRVRLEQLRAEASDLLSGAARALIHTVPKSPQGALALLNFVQQREETGDYFLETGATDEEDTDTLEAALRRTLISFLRTQLS